VFGAKFALPVRELNGSARQPFLNINLPAPDADIAPSIGHPLAVSLSKGSLQIGELDTFTLGATENS
jgi:hypothetical protein